MSDSRNVNIGCGGSLPVTATVLMMILKLAGVIDWSWWAVFSPMIVVGAIGVLILLGAGMAIAFALIIRGRK